MTERPDLTRVWRSQAPTARLLRGVLLPAAGLYRAGVAARNFLYERVLREHVADIPVVSVGNLTVGGTGKTPVAAWLVRLLREHGARPAVVMRGYGGDEPLVHRELNREVPVFVDADRVAGIASAVRVGCDVAVLDDAFQHRRAARDEDIVLISVDAWDDARAMLPAGPWREPLSAVRRATLILLTVKAPAGGDGVDQLMAELAAVAPAVPLGVARLAPRELRSMDGTAVQSLSHLRGRSVLAVAAVARPQLFFDQLAEFGARITERAFPDHHAFTRRDVAALRAAASRHDILVCTLKDAVKLRPLWPADAPAAWYVSQAVSIEQGQSHVSDLVRRLLAARHNGRRAPAPSP